MPTKRRTTVKRRAARKKAAITEEVMRPATLDEMVSGVAGDTGSKILESIGDGATDESIEKKTGLKLAQVRSLLNHLHSYGLVEYTREKNMQTGWFTYTWKVNLERFFQNVLTMKKREYESVRDKITGSQGAQFYKCKKACARLAFDQAMEFKFKCPDCRQALNYVRSEDEIAVLEHHIGALQTVLERNQPEKAQVGVAR